MERLGLPIVWGYCRKTPSATAAEEDRMDLLWRIQCDLLYYSILSTRLQPYSDYAWIHLLRLSDRCGCGARSGCTDEMFPRWCGVGWWCPARVWRQGVHLPVLVSNGFHTWQRTTCNSLVHILRILVISFDAGWSQALHGVGLFALVTASGFACAGSLPKTPTEAQCEMSMT